MDIYWAIIVIGACWLLTALAVMLWIFIEDGRIPDARAAALGIPHPAPARSRRSRSTGHSSSPTTRARRYRLEQELVLRTIMTFWAGWNLLDHTLGWVWDLVPTVHL